MERTVKKCAYDGCTKRPAFGLEGGKATHCKMHSTAMMVDVKNKKCAHDGCTLRAAFGLEGGKGTHCQMHKTAVMVDVKKKFAHEEWTPSR